MKRIHSLVICAFLLASVFCSDTYAEQTSSILWQRAYLNLLEEKRAERGPYTPGVDRFESYALYDIDKDGVPELFLRYGTSTASSTCFLYSFMNNMVYYIDQFYFGSSELYSFPSDNGVLLVYGHMFHAKTQLLSLTEGRLDSSLFYEEVIDQMSGSWYTPVSDYCPGSVLITEFFYDQDFPLTSYYSWTQPAPVAAEVHCPNYDDSFFANAINNDATAVKVRFPYININLNGNDVEVTTIGTVLNSLINRTTDESGTPIVEYQAFLADLNRDGQLEYLISQEKRSQGENAVKPFMMILSEQNGTIYAYVDELSSFTNVDTGGILYYYNDSFGYIWESAYRVFFDAENWMKLDCALDDYTGPHGNIETDNGEQKV